MYKPMLAEEGTIDNIVFPKIALPKYNGMRGCIMDGFLKARSLKPIENLHISELLSNHRFNDLEGELVVGDPLSKDVFTNTVSGVNTIKGTPDFHFYLFDMFHPDLLFLERRKLLSDKYRELGKPSFMSIVPMYVVKTREELIELYDKLIAEGYEGLVLRDPDSKYKQGRTTILENTFLRYVPWQTSEATILGYKEGYINTNPSEINELGRRKKSLSKDKLVPSGVAGSVQVEDIHTGANFSITVPTDELGKDVLENFEQKWRDKTLRYRFKKGVKGNTPRTPQWDGLRPLVDIIIKESPDAKTSD